MLCPQNNLNLCIRTIGCVTAEADATVYVRGLGTNISSTVTGTDLSKDIDFLEDSVVYTKK